MNSRISELKAPLQAAGESKPLHKRVVLLLGGTSDESEDQNLVS